MPSHNLIDRTGRRFGRLTVIRRLENGAGKTRWLCRCDCGNELISVGGNLDSGNTRSCGCLNLETVASLGRRKKHGMDGTRIYRVWINMKSRCADPNHKSFPDYGARGIKVCDRWVNSFENFYADMGDRPGRATLERIDNDRGYEPENVRWASFSEQAINKRTTVRLSFRGETMTLSEWEKRTGIAHQTISRRLRSGWPLERALTKR